MLKREEKSIEVLFITKNKHKFQEAKLIAESYGIKLVQSQVEKIEIQSDNLEEIVLYASRNLPQEVRNRIYILEDAGLFIETLNGFPGPYSSYVFKTLGCRGIITLLKNHKKPWRAYFKSVVLLHLPDKGDLTFVGITKGIISDKIRGSKGFGFDPIFIPNEIGDKTYAELSIIEKNKVSHRGKAMRATFEYLKFILEK